MYDIASSFTFDGCSLYILRSHTQELSWTSRNNQSTKSTIITKTRSEDEMGMALQFVSYILFPGAMKISHCLVHHPNNKKTNSWVAWCQTF